MKKEDLKWKALALYDAIESDEREEFDDGEIEDLVVEAGIPIFQSNGKQLTQRGLGFQDGK